MVEETQIKEPIEEIQEQDVLKPVQLEDLSLYKFLGSWKTNRSQSRSFFSVAQMDEEKNTYRSNLWLFENEEVRIFTSEGKEFSYFFEDDDTILFSGNRGDDYGIDNMNFQPKSKRSWVESKATKTTKFYRLSLRGGEATLAFTLPFAGAQLIEVLGDSRYLFMASVDTRLPEVQDDYEAYEKAEKELKEKDFCHHIEEIPFQRNGAGYRYAKRERLYLYDAKTASVQAITKDPFASVAGISISEDKKKAKILCIYQKEVLVYREFLYDLDLESLEMTQIHYGNDNLLFHALFELDQGCFAFAKNGKSSGLNEFAKLWYLNSENTFECLSDFNVEIGNATGSDVRYGGFATYEKSKDQKRLRFIETIKDHAALMEFLPVSELKDDGFVSSKDMAQQAFPHLGSYAWRELSVNIQGEAVKYIIRPLFSDPYRSVEGFVVQDHHIYLTLLCADKLQEIYRLDTYKDVVCLTHFNDKALENRKLSRPIFFEAMREKPLDNPDEALEGYVLKPLSDALKVNEKYPAILNVHGGPATVYGALFYHEMQLEAGKGYYVLHCNPRGSSGRGSSYSDIRQAYGTVDYEDIMKFLDDALKAYPDIDPNRISVSGGSYGGFMMNWIQGHTDRFAAIVTQRSISNWISFYGTSDIGYYFAIDQNDKSWDYARCFSKELSTEDFGQRNFSVLWERSPLAYVDSMKTPMLIIHSDEDYRCPLEQGFQMFTALKRRGVPTKLVVFNGENHDLSRSGKPKARLERLSEILLWIEKYTSQK